MKKLAIRNATSEDAAILANTERIITQTPGFLVSRPHEIKDESFTAKIDYLTSVENGIYIVGEIDGNIIGHAMLDPISLKSLAHVARLTLVIHPEWQGKGLGKALLLHLIKWAKESPYVEKIELQVRSTNLRARSLYKNMGFIEEGTLQRHIKIGCQKYVNEIIMGLWVSSDEEFDKEIMSTILKGSPS